MCDKAVAVDSKMLKFVPDHFKTQEMCEKRIAKIVVFSNTCSWSVWNSLFKKLFQNTLQCCNLFLIATKVNKVIKETVDCHPHV